MVPSGDEALLKMGSRIRVVAPSSWISEDVVERISVLTERAGLDVSFAPQCFLQHHQFAGDDPARAEAFVSAMSDPQYDAIWFARGGYGAGRMMEFVDWDDLANRCRGHPAKIVIGYSDTTPLLEIAASRKLAIPVHGPMPNDVNDAQKSDSLRQFLDDLVSVPRSEINRRAFSKCTVLRPGTARGQLRGGNLTLVTKMIAGDHSKMFSGSILFLEDFDEYYYAIDRNFLCLRQAGVLQNLSGVAIGQFTKLSDNPRPFGVSIAEMVLYHCRNYEYPIVSDLQAGHGTPNVPLLLDQEIGFVASHVAPDVTSHVTPDAAPHDAVQWDLL